MRADNIVRTQLMLAQALFALAEDISNSTTYSIGTVNATNVNLELVLFADLPVPTGAGALAAVSNSNTAVWGANIAGGGANKVLAFFNGTNWTVAGK